MRHSCGESARKALSALRATTGVGALAASVGACSSSSRSRARAASRRAPHSRRRGPSTTTVDVHPRRRDEAPELRVVNPLQRVPALRDGDEHVYETGAVLLYLVERLPGPRARAAARASRAAGALLRWVTWLSNTLHGAFHPLDAPRFLTDDPAGHEGIGRKGRERLDAHGAYLEARAHGAERGASATSSRSPTSTSTCSRAGRATPTATSLGGEQLAAHYERVGARPAIARTRGSTTSTSGCSATTPSCGPASRSLSSRASTAVRRRAPAAASAGIDVAARDDEHRRPVGRDDGSGLERRERQRRRRLDEELRLESEPAHRLEHGVLRDGHDLVDERGDGGERQLAERLRADAVADRARHVRRRPGDDASLAQRLPGRRRRAPARRRRRARSGRAP